MEKTVKLIICDTEGVSREKAENLPFITLEDMQVHDELVFEVRKTEVERIKRTVQELMSTALQLSVPLDVEINEGKSWYEAH